MSFGKVVAGRARLDDKRGPPYPYRVVYNRNGREVEELEYFTCRLTPPPHHSPSIHTALADAPITGAAAEDELEDGEIANNLESQSQACREIVEAYSRGGGVAAERLFDWTAPNLPWNTHYCDGVYYTPFRAFRPEQMDHFWTTIGVIQVGKNVMVKRCFDGLLDNTYISRKNVKSDHNTVFKIASFCLKDLISYMEGMLAKISISSLGIHQLAGLPLLLATQIDGNEFWSEGEDTFHMNELWMKPYLTDWGMIQFRVWNQVPERLHRHFQDGSPAWTGPRCSLTMPVFLELVGVLKHLQKRGAERY